MKELVLLFFCVSFISYGQIENRWQPDSVYANHKVKKIYVYLNSPKDLSEIVEFDKNGNRIRIEKYSASYNRRTRKRKSLDHIIHFEYDKKGFLIRELDSTIYYENKYSVDKKIYEYDSISRLKAIKYFQRDFKNPISQKSFYYEPFRTIYKKRRDSIIAYQETKVYDKDFYVRRRFGYSLQPKLKKSEMSYYDKDSLLIKERVSYSDYNDLKRTEISNYLSNTFDEKENLINSVVEYGEENDRKWMYELNYKYYKNGLLKSVRGYVPRYFKYEFWE